MELKANSFDKVGTNLTASQSIIRPGMSFWQDAIRRFKTNKIAFACLIYLVIMVIGCLIIPILSKYSISDQDLENTYAGFFKAGHWFGTDVLGRDVFVRVWFGTRISLFIAVTAVFVDLIIGVLYGGISGYFGGKIDNMMMRILEIIIGIPILIVVILLMVVLKPGVVNIIVAYATVGWTGMARLVRGQVIQLKEQEYVLAAKVLGSNSWRIILKHLLPNVLGVIIVNVTLTIPSAIFTEAFLSYIGLGVQIPLASLGTLASDGTASFQMYPHLLLIPAMFICLTMLSFNLLGDALRDVLDPRLRK
jgi:oligopeptide transport system permease protein